MITLIQKLKDGYQKKLREKKLAEDKQKLVDDSKGEKNIFQQKRQPNYADAVSEVSNEPYKQNLSQNQDASKNRVPSTSP